jgi:hypothetical protein
VHYRTHEIVGVATVATVAPEGHEQLAARKTLQSRSNARCGRGEPPQRKTGRPRNEGPLQVKPAPPRVCSATRRLSHDPASDAQRLLRAQLVLAEVPRRYRLLGEWSGEPAPHEASSLPPMPDSSPYSKTIRIAPIHMTTLPSPISTRETVSEISRTVEVVRRQCKIVARVTCSEEISASPDFDTI